MAHVKGILALQIELEKAEWQRRVLAELGLPMPMLMGGLVDCNRMSMR